MARSRIKGRAMLDVFSKMARMERSARSFLGVLVVGRARPRSLVEVLRFLLGVVLKVSLSLSSSPSGAEAFFLEGDLVGVLVIPPARERARYFFLRRFVDEALERREKRTISCFGWVWEAK